MYLAKMKDEFGDEVKNNIKYTQNEGEMEIVIHTPKVGIYELEIYAKYKEGEGDNYSGILGFSINSKGESAPFPFYFSEYERLGIELIEPLTGLIETKTGEGNVEIRWGEEELEITSNLRLLGEEYNLKQSTHVDYIHKGAIISCRTPNPGLYLLTIYGRRIVDEIGKAIISFQVLSTMEGGQYVREYGVFEGKLISPLHSQLKLGLQYEFKVRSLHAISIQLIFPQNNIKLIKGENNIWYLKAALTHQQFKDTETTINMKFPDKGNLCYTLCKYKITE